MNAPSQRRSAEMTYPGGLTPEQWGLVARNTDMAWIFARRWAGRCGYATRADEFYDELLAALMRAARRFDPAKGCWKPYARMWLASAIRRCRAKRVQWDRHIHCIHGSPAGAADGIHANAPGGVRSCGADPRGDYYESEWTPKQAEVRPDTGRVDDRDEVAHAMDGLDGRTKRILHAIFWEGATQRDAGAVEGISDSRVGQILNDAYRQMRGKLAYA